MKAQHGGGGAERISMGARGPGEIAISMGARGPGKISISMGARGPGEISISNGSTEVQERLQSQMGARGPGEIAPIGLPSAVSSAGAGQRSGTDSSEDGGKAHHLCPEAPRDTTSCSSSSCGIAPVRRPAASHSRGTRLACTCDEGAIRRSSEANQV